MNTERTASIGGDASGISIARDRNGVQAPALPAADVPRRTEEYLETVAREWAWVRLEGEGGAPLPLERVFFMLQARPQPQRRPLEPPRPDLEPSPERLEAAGAPPEEPAPPPPPVPLGQALREAEHLALLGEPGAGKSTALQFIGLCFARAKEGWHTERLGVEEPLIPVLLQLPVQAEALARGETLWDALCAEVRCRLQACTDAEAKTLLRAGSDEKRLLVLLDGLDEVREAERAAVIEQIQRFVHSGRGRVVVASRPAGFSSLVGVKEYTLKPFEDPEKEALPYLRGWLQALKPEWAPQAEEKARRLLEEMRARPALARLLNNPLLLRLSAEYYVRTGRVAESRAALYEAWVEEAWRRALARGAPADQKGAALQALEALSWHFQTGGSHGEEALRKGLERAGLPDPQGLLRLLREGTGLLARFAGEQEGRTVYSYFFAHQTVQEYFVARRLQRAWETSPRRTFAFLRPRLHLPAWREPLALLAGMLPEEEALALLRRIQRAKSPGERHLRRDLFLAADLARESGRWEAARAHLLPVLIGALRDEAWWIRRAAAEILGNIGDPQAVPALIGALRDERDKGGWVRWAAAEALGKVGTPALSDLIRVLQDKDWMARWAAAGALGKIGDSRALPNLIGALQDENEDVRKVAAESLGKIGDPQAIPTLIEALRDESWLVRHAATEALGRIGISAVPALLRALEDEGAEVRRAAAEALGEIGDPQTVPALVATLRDKDWGVRRAAVWALGKIGSPALPILVKALQDETLGARDVVVRALGNTGDPQAVPLLLGAVRDKDAGVRRAAAGALGRIGDPQALPALIGALWDENEWVRRTAVEALGSIGDLQALPILLRVLQDKDVGVRMAVAGALGRIGVVGIFALIRMLEDENADVRRVTAEALGKISSPQATPSLMRLLQDENWVVRQMAARGLREIGDPQAFPALIRALENENPEVRWAMAWALEAILPRMPIPADARERRALRHLLRRVQRAAVKLNDHDLLDAVLGARSALEAAASPWQDPLQPSPGEARRAQVRRALGRVAGGAALLLLLGGAGLAAVLVAGAQGALKEALQPLWQEWPLAALVGLVFLLAALAGLLGWGIEALRSARRRGAD